MVHDETRPRWSGNDSMAGVLRLRVVAEGVEEEGQRDLLQEMNTTNSRASCSSSRCPPARLACCRASRAQQIPRPAALNVCSAAT
jgi:hypothetical protein